MQKFWMKIRPWWHIGTTLFIIVCSVIYWVHDQSELIPRVEALELKMEKLDLVKQRVEDIADFIGVPRRSGFDNDR